MKEITKIQIAGVGGQGVIYLTNILVEAAMIAGIPCATSEVLGLSQRGGSVNSGMTFGENTYGFIEKAGADFLIGLEPLEAQRCVSYLNKNSRVIIDNCRILPYSVNAGTAIYPNTKKFIEYLDQRINEVMFIEELPKTVSPISRNLFVAGCVCQMEGFPLKFEHIEEAVKNSSKEEYSEKSLKALSLGREYFLKV